MNNRFISNKQVINKIILYVIFLVYGCHKPINHFDKNNIKFNIKFLGINSINQTDEIGDILFITKVENHSDNIFSINNDFNNTLNNIQTHIVLLSDRIRTGAIGVNMSIGAQKLTLESNKSGIISFNLSFDALKDRLIPVNDKEITKLDVKKFLNSSDYLLVLINPQKSTSYFFSKSESLRCSSSLDSLKKACINN